MFSLKLTTFAVMKNVYEKIRELRKAKDINQAVLAEKLNLTPAGYSKLERGDVQLTIERAYELATIFGVSVVELLGEGASVVLVGANDSTKEVEALKAKIEALEREIQDLREIKHLQNDKILSQTKVLNNTIYYAKKIIANQIFYYDTVCEFDKMTQPCFMNSFVDYFSRNPDAYNLFASMESYNGNEKDNMKKMYQGFHKFLIDAYREETEYFDKIEIYITKHRATLNELIESKSWNFVRYEKYDFNFDEIVENYKEKIRVLESIAKKRSKKNNT